MKKVMNICILLLTLCTNSCIEPPLRLPAQEVLIDVPVVQTQMELVWNVETDWKSEWYYGWDEADRKRWGEMDYPKPASFEVRRYFLGQEENQPHSNVDPFTISGNHFKRTFEFGYYDMLIWSNIESPDNIQALIIDEQDMDSVKATTTVTKSVSLSKAEDPRPTAMYNQPEVFYSSYPQNIYISRNFDDYDYYDEVEKTWVKKINCNMDPRVFIYFVQIVLLNNDGRVAAVTEDAAISAFANGTSINTGRTSDVPCVVCFETNLKKGLVYKGIPADIAGGKMTTFGLCDMPGIVENPSHVYSGPRTDIKNYLLFEIKMSKGSIKNYQVDITSQCRKQSHGGVITVVLDCSTLEDIVEDGGHSIFNPMVDDYEEITYDIPL